jgi:hypothetical protein
MKFDATKNPQGGWRHGLGAHARQRPQRGLERLLLVIMLLLAFTNFARAQDDGQAAAAAPPKQEDSAPRQVDSNPQDGEVYKVPDGVVDKTPNLKGPQNNDVQAGGNNGPTPSPAQLAGAE